MLAQTNDCLFDAGRGDLSKALERQAPRSYVSPHTVPLQAYAVPPTTLRPIQMERDNMLQAPTFSKARFPRASLTNKFEIRESQNADSKKKWARAAGDPWEIELGEGLGWGVIIASKALIEIEAGCGMRQGSMVLKAGYLSLKVLHEVHRNHRTGVVRAAAAGMGKQEGPATERSTARLEFKRSEATRRASAGWAFGTAPLEVQTRTLDIRARRIETEKIKGLDVRGKSGIVQDHCYERANTEVRGRSFSRRQGADEVGGANLVENAAALVEKLQVGEEVSRGLNDTRGDSAGESGGIG
ncbi:hypothetical protein FA13DRAFT_1722124 [Coprinellus micaceus]|uniref:Uncharacterized protein n=1 Tax=Coprinellus micaceus TaxID=71717 RepID=A0A4Y7RQJ7_COPMI|nr:hypothetical protein FA13DRAFT_1722124 [Coprinellus micaceus]